MGPDRWKRIEELYHAARAKDSSDRAIFLAEACGNDAALRVEIENLLAQGEALSQLESKVRTTDAGADLTANAMIGPYRVKERLDAGGMGVVYRAIDTRLGRQVAVKIALAQFSDRSYREARSIAKLNHPNVCTLHDIGSTPEIPGYLVLEFVEGQTLAEKLATGRLSVAETVQIARQIAGALTAAHAQGIVHRDLKPANVKITPQGVVKVLDFGLAKPFGELRNEFAIQHSETNGMLTAAGTILGTAAYMSPEQAAGKDADARSDIFSFVIKAEPKPPRAWRPEIPERLEQIVLKSLQRSPDQRYASAAELQQDLESFLRTETPPRLLPLRVTIGATVLAIAVIAGYFGVRSYWHRSDLHWLEQTAVPEITKLLQQDRALEALQLYRKAERISPDSKLLYKLAEGVASHPVEVVSTPPGARIYLSDYVAAAGEDLSQWQFAGTAPLMTTEIPNWGYYHLRAVKDGFAPVDQVVSYERKVVVTLHETSAAPPGMVWVPPTSATTVTPSISLPGFWIDRYEVTNRQFKEFVDAGGYRKKEYWKEPFAKEGRTISWEQALNDFHDLTARLGPANWSLGTYPDGTADFPVAGVSWYEAMAYAEFAGKSIPTVYEWRSAAPIDANAEVIQMSNFSGKGLSAVGAHHGMTLFGAYDMAGNVAEWTTNASGNLRYVLGGAWDEASYIFTGNDARDPFWRTVSMGFRTVERIKAPPSESFAALHLETPQPERGKPVEDAEYRLLEDLHRYQPTDLDSRIERTDDTSPSKKWTGPSNGPVTSDVPWTTSRLEKISTAQKRASMPSVGELPTLRACSLWTTDSKRRLCCPVA
jgi:eukaryotic-like serine/threonine-protein kinase